MANVFIELAVAFCAIQALLPNTSAINISRRHILSKGSVSSVGVGFLTAGAFLVPNQANAARGAAELDLEYYVRDLMAGNRREGSILPSSQPALPPPRTIDAKLSPLLLDDTCSSRCLATSALVETILLSRDSTNPSSSNKIVEDIQTRVADYQRLAGRSFYARAPWKEASVSDQYYFDLTSYAFWRTAAELLPDYVARDVFMRRLGRRLLETAQMQGLIRPVALGSGDLVASVEPMKEILHLFNRGGFCSGYRLGDMGANKKAGRDIPPLFDEFDNDAIRSGATVDCLVSILEPATLSASLQITGEQSRFAPDFVSPVLAALWEQIGVQSSWETYFVDPEYRPNPKDYFPNEQLIQFTLSLKSSG